MALIVRIGFYLNPGTIIKIVKSETLAQYHEVWIHSKFCNQPLENNSKCRKGEMVDCSNNYLNMTNQIMQDIFWVVNISHNNFSKKACFSMDEMIFFVNKVLSDTSHKKAST